MVQVPGTDIIWSFCGCVAQGSERACDYSKVIQLRGSLAALVLNLSQNAKVLGLVHETRLDGGPSRRPSSRVVSMVMMLLSTFSQVVPFMSSMSHLPFQ